MGASEPSEGPGARRDRLHTPCRWTTLGVYLHVPFCERVCPYCDFAVVAARTLGRAAEERYVAALLRELAARRGAFAGRRLASVYFGGGTPALLAPASVARLLAAVRGAFAGEPRRGDARGEPEHARARAAARVPRGGRRPPLARRPVLRRRRAATARAARTAREGRRTLARRRDAGFANLSLDLIFAAPGQDLAALERDLAEACRLSPRARLGVRAHARARHALRARRRARAARGPGRGDRRRDDRARRRAARGGRLRALRDLELRAAGLRGACTTRATGSGARARPRHGRRVDRSAAPGRALRRRAARTRARSTPSSRSAAGARARRGGGARRRAPRAARRRSSRCARAAGLDAARFAREFGAPPRAFFGDAIDGAPRAGLLDGEPDGRSGAHPRGRLLADSRLRALRLIRRTLR